jgi:hypothetical protein
MKRQKTKAEDTEDIQLQKIHNDNGRPGQIQKEKAKKTAQMQYRSFFCVLVFFGFFGLGWLLLVVTIVLVVQSKPAPNSATQQWISRQAKILRETGHWSDRRCVIMMLAEKDKLL